jgi:uncharacterized membrane protein YphA (DoxX/SURF4 family)
MKTAKISYYTTTGIIALMMTYSAITYLTQPAMAQTFQHLGYPAYFRVELAIAKLIGVALLVAPVFRRMKELAYAGFALTFVSAFIAHTCSGDPMPYPLIPLVFLAILAGSYVSYSKWQTATTK